MKLQRVIIGALAPGFVRAVAAGPDDVLLLTFFRDNGQHGVNLAVSANGVDFTELNGGDPVFRPPAWPGQNLTRDASILYRDGRSGSQHDNRMYITRTRDFATFTDAKLFYDGGFASTDAVMRLDEARQRWVMVIKCSRDERRTG